MDRWRGGRRWRPRVAGRRCPHRAGRWRRTRRDPDRRRTDEGDEPMTDEQVRIRGYLTSQGAKLAPAEIIDKVRAAMDQLRAATAEVPEARFGERPAAEEWSANEVMAHVVNAGRHFGGAITRLLDG